MTCRTSPDVSEDAEPFYHRPVPRPQAAALFIPRCAARSLSRSTRSSQRGAVVRVEARSGQQRPPRLLQQPPRGGSVATDPGAERWQPGAGRGGHLAVHACCDQTACVWRGLARSAMLACVPIRVCVSVERRLYGVRLHMYRGLTDMGPLGWRRSRWAAATFQKWAIS